jgi:predicted Zn-dependent peptidase
VIEELERARVRSIVDLELAPTVPEVIGTRLPWAYLAGRDLSLVAERERIKAVTTEAAAAWCRDTLKASNAALAVLGPAAKEIEKRLKKALIAGLG